MAKYGYVRVSTKEQKTDRQMEAMLEYGVNVKNIFTDKLSGKDFNRPSYKKLVKKLKKGDLLVIKSIDRLGRDYKEILEEWRKIVRTKGVDIEVIDLPLLNTTQEIDGIAGLLIHIIGTQILSIKAGEIVSVYKGYTNLPCVLYSVAVFVFLKDLGSVLTRTKIISKMISFFRSNLKYFISKY